MFSCTRLATLLWRVATCWVLNIELTSTHAQAQHCCTNLAKRLQRHATSANVVAGKIWKWSNLSQQHPTYRLNRVTKRVQHVAPNNVTIWCVEMLGQMLLSLDWGFMIRLSQSIATILLGVKCWACALSLVRFVLVAIEQVVNPELAKTTVLGGCLPFTLISSTIVQMVSLVWMGHLPLTQKRQFYRERLGGVQLDHNSKMAVKNCKRKANFPLGYFRWNFFENFAVGRAETCLPVAFWLKFLELFWR